MNKDTKKLKKSKHGQNLTIRFVYNHYLFFSNLKLKIYLLYSKTESILSEILYIF